MTPAARYRDVLLVLIALVQCYATRTQSGCAPLSYHATMAECGKLASEYQKFDTRDLRVKGVPAVVSYHCVAVSDRKRPWWQTVIPVITVARRAGECGSCT
jgi:hypothetical protein